MKNFSDLNELITVARQINEGRYDVIDVNLSPSSELFSIAQFFNDSVKKLKTVSSTVEGSFKELPAFEGSLMSVINDSKKASEDVLGFVDQINFNIDGIRETLSNINDASSAGDYTRARGLLDRLKDICSEGGEISFDIISSLEFKEMAQSRINKIVAAVDQLEERLAHLIISLSLKQQLITAEAVDKLKEPKEILQDQNLVNKLLQEFGL